MSEFSHKCQNFWNTLEQLIVFESVPCFRNLVPKKCHFIMPRRRYYKRHNKDKYSVEQTVLVTSSVSTWNQVIGIDGQTQTSRQYSQPIVKNTEVQGMRKVKHLTLTICNSGTELDVVPMLYAIVYVPEGYFPKDINYPISGNPMSLYEPNQFVMSCGVLDFNAGPLRIKSPLSRNLNSGDSIYIILATNSSESGRFTLNVRYAITLQ